MITEAELKEMQAHNTFETFQNQLWDYFIAGWITKELYVKYSEDMQNMNILAIDFSTASTGYAFTHPLSGDKVVGSLSGGKSKDPMERTNVIAEQLIEIIEYYAISDYFIAIEEPIIVRRTKRNMSLVRANGFFLAMMRAKFNMGYIDVPNSLWASHHLITGKRAERKKQSMKILEAAKIVPVESINDDMADAYCILTYMEEQNK